ncbi:MAG TPA: glycosyltransferase [Desulfobacterales bacterium]|nr:glycosyltransferase [Desulfobacterales bacterium]
MIHLEENLVSCIIPTHNRSYLLKTALNSVISQTYKNLEIIIINDASKDNTEYVIKEYMKYDNRIKYHKNTINLGGSGARNAGINIAKGEFIAFLDDDDEWVNNKIESQLKHIDDCDALLCASINKDTNKVISYSKSKLDPNDLIKGNICGTSNLFARSSIIKDNLFDEKLPGGQDWDIYIRLATKYKLIYLREPLVVYNNGEHDRMTNIMINMSTDQFEKRMAVLYKHKALLGPFWFNYHMARTLLSYFTYRKNKMEQLLYTIKKCGAFPVLRVFIHETIKKLNLLKLNELFTEKISRALKTD